MYVNVETEYNVMHLIKSRLWNIAVAPRFNVVNSLYGIPDAVTLAPVAI